MCPTNVFFGNYNAFGEQTLIEDLIIESIRIYGMDVYFLPRFLRNEDKLYGEDTISEYNSSYFVEMYIKDVYGFQGEGDFLSKFNMQIRDQITFTIARRVFYDEIGNREGLPRPKEGDLIYFPLNKKVFIVKFVEHESIFYQLGALQTYDLQCELWEYSNELLNTGIYEIDKLGEEHSLDLQNFYLYTEDPLYLTDEIGNYLASEDEVPDFQTQVGDHYEDNTEIQEEADEIINFSDANPFADGAY